MALPCMSEYDINSEVRGQRHGNTKGVGCQLKCMEKQASLSYAVASSSTSAPALTSS